jgi:hypothetical protein
MWCFGRCGAKQYAPKGEVEAAIDVGAAAAHAAIMSWANVGEPHASELTNYVKQRGDHVHIYHTAAEVRSKMLRAVGQDSQQLIDQYPKGEVLSILFRAGCQDSLCVSDSLICRQHHEGGLGTCCYYSEFGIGKSLSCRIADALAGCMRSLG